MPIYSIKRRSFVAATAGLAIYTSVSIEYGVSYVLALFAVTTLQMLDARVSL